MSKFIERSDLLAELCGLPRQSVCFQILTLIQMCHRGLDDGEVVRYESGGELYFEFRSLKKYLANIKTASNAKTGLGALVEAGFLNKVVLSRSGEEIVDSSFFRGSASIYYRLSHKGAALFGLDSPC
ncbi:hypothetical protein [Vibrio sinaloensis]|uniref:hypothetical protein n=1 Tax=Photobacterium sp. (strain ATCC 43367) TaxID=379097 RepID=UPI0035ED8075